MSIATRILVRLKKNRPEYTEAMNAALIEMLTDRQRTVWNCTGQGYEVDSASIANGLKIELYSASIALKAIYDTGLLVRRYVVGSDGKRAFAYRRVA